MNPEVAVQITNLNARAQAAVASIPVSLVTSSMGEASRQRSEKAEGSVDSDGSPSAAGQGDSSRRGAALQMLENNLDLTQARKTGKVGDLTSRLARLGLTVEETRRFYALTKPDQLKLLDEPGLIPKRILAIAELLPSTPTCSTSILRRRQLHPPCPTMRSPAFSSRLFGGSCLELSTRRQSLIRNRDGSKRGGSAGRRRPALLGESLKDTTGSRSRNCSNFPRSSYGRGYSPRRSRRSAVEDSIGASDSGGLASLEAGEVLANPSTRRLLPCIANGERSVGRRISDFSGQESRWKVPSHWLLISPDPRAKPLSWSRESLSMEGDFSWADKPEDAARLVVMSAGEMKLAKGMTLQSATGDLILSSRSDMNLDGVRLEVSREALIRGMGDVSLVDTRIGADAMATVKAARNLNVDGLTFSRGVSSILMEATTIRLSNVDFPAASAVRLNSLKGPIDGRYPHFGTAIPAADQIGRVNFLKNVSSGGNQIMTRQAFDQFGKNITIGKTPGL